VTRLREPTIRLCTKAAAECACQGLRRASRAITRLYEATLAAFDLTATQFTILVALSLRDPVPLSRLAQDLVLDRTSLYRAVKPLERRGCLRTLAGRTQRERTAELTQKGRRLLEDALPEWERVQQRLVGTLGPRAWAIMQSAIDRVVPAVRAIESGEAPARPGRRRRATRG